MNIAEYKAVCGLGADCKKLNKAVAELLKEGFEPLGDVSTCADNSTVYVTQVMVKFGKKRRMAGPF